MSFLPEPLDDHFRLLRERDAIGRMTRAIGYLEEIGCAYVVEGGWAVSAHGSPVGSVDLDVLLSADDVDRLHAGLVKVAGIQLDTERGQELVGIDFRYGDAPNALQGRPELHYVPFQLLAGRVGRMGLPVAGDVTIPVPTIEVLALMKAKAFHDRRLFWEASRDPVLFAALDVEDQRWARQFDTAHWERKAGKDLFDLAFLARRGATSRDWAAWVGAEFVETVRRALRGAPLPLRRFAEAMATRAGVDRLDIPPKY